MRKTLIDRTMDINKDTREGQKEITVSVQYSRTGPWELINININPQAFLNAKSKSVYIRNIVESTSLGMTIVSLESHYTEDDAKKDLNLE